MKRKYILYVQILLCLFGAVQHSLAQNSIVRIEYAVDSLPEYGQGTAIPITTANEVTANFNLPLANINSGFHILYLRAEDQYGNWGICQYQSFYRLQLNSSSNANKQINYLEYFVDSLKEYGSGTPVSISPADTINTTFNLPLSDINSGFHILYLRAKDVNGNWSIVQNQSFYRLQINSTNILNKQISYLEYFVDSLTEFGSGTPIPISQDDHINATFNLPLADIQSGFHILYLRAKDVNGNWSIVQNQSFYRLQINSANTLNKQISYLEYFVDSLTEYGSGTPIPITQDDHINATFNLPLSDINSGFHILYLRAKDVNGNWSIVQNQSFYRLQIDSNALQANKKIQYMEYFLDTDPGYGNATSIATTENMEVTNEVYVPLFGLPNGVHYFFARVRDNKGDWSIVQYDTIKLKFPPQAAGEISGTNTMCLPVDSVLYSVPPILYASSYIWTFPNGAIGTSDSNFIWVNYPLNASSGTIRVKGHNEYGDGAESTLPLTLYPYLNVSIYPEITSFCAGESIYLNAMVISGGNVPRYQWYVNNLPVSNDATYSFQPQEGDSVYCTVVSDIGCLLIKDAQTDVKVYHQGINRTLRVKLFLEGLFDNTTATMHEAQDIDFNSGNVFPMFGAGIADKIDIQVHQGDDRYTTFLSESNLSLSTTGFADLVGKCEDNGNYYISIKSRNHLETWSAIPVPFSTNPVMYDFSTNAYNAYQAPGGNDPQIQLLPGIFAFYLGDLDQSMSVDFDDFNLFEPYLNDGTYGFTIADFNGNGLVDFDDFNLFEPRLNMGPFTQYPGMMK